MWLWPTLVKQVKTEIADGTEMAQPTVVEGLRAVGFDDDKSYITNTGEEQKRAIQMDAIITKERANAEANAKVAKQ